MTNTQSPEDRLAEIKQRLSDATPGPWHQLLFSADGSNDPMPEVLHKTVRICVATYHGHKDSEKHISNAKLIAHCPTDLAYLIDQLEKCQADLALAVEALKNIEFCPRSMSDYVIQDMQYTAQGALAKLLSEGGDK